MATLIRAELSTKNKYYIDRHRYYELKHFCLQYNEWRKAYSFCNESIIFTSKFNKVLTNGMPGDLTAKYAIQKVQYSEKIKLIEQIAEETDEILYPYILRAVTEGLSYTQLKMKMDIPCSRDTYYDRYRKFFWILDIHRN